MLCTSILDVATDGLAIDILEENERGLSNGLMWGARTFGVSFAALLGSFLLRNYGLSQAFVYFGIIILVSIICCNPQKENHDDKFLSLDKIREKRRMDRLKGELNQAIQHINHTFALYANFILFNI